MISEKKDYVHLRDFSGQCSTRPQIEGGLVDVCQCPEQKTMGHLRRM